MALGYTFIVQMFGKVYKNRRICNENNIKQIIIKKQIIERKLT